MLAQTNNPKIWFYTEKTNKTPHRNSNVLTVLMRIVLVSIHEWSLLCLVLVLGCYLTDGGCTFAASLWCPFIHKQQMHVSNVYYVV